MPDRMSVAACERMMRASAEHCSVPPPPIPVQPASSGVGDSLNAVAASIALATFGLALLTLALAVVWILYVRYRTKAEAKTEVARVVPPQVRDYLDERVPGMVAEYVAAIMAGQGGSGGGMTAEDQAATLGSESGQSPGGG